jgi:undecaprenyl diphosphate synthase
VFVLVLLPLSLASFCWLQVYAFSLENWQRDQSEVTFLMNLFRSALQQQLPELQRNGVCLQFMGQLQLLPPALQQQIAECSAATAGNSELLLNVAVSYSAQHDMVQAVQRLAQQVQDGTFSPEQVSTKMIDGQVLQVLHGCGCLTMFGMSVCGGFIKCGWLCTHASQH